VLDRSLNLSRLGRPERPRLAEARAAVEHCTNPQDAWETLAARGLIPLEWLAPGRRWFLPEYPPRNDVQSAMSDRPRSVEDCVAFASDYAAIHAAEALAREMSHALSVWGATAPTILCWRVARRPLIGAFAKPFVTPADAARGALGLDAPAVDAAARVAVQAILDATGDLLDVSKSLFTSNYAGRAVYAAARARGLPIRGLVAGSYAYHSVPAALVGRTFAEVPDPFEPLFALLALGYSVDDSEIRLTLNCPALPP
jgi:hypothetical protein